MHQVHIQVVSAKIGQGLLTGGDNVLWGVLVVPQLGGDPELLARESLKDRSYEVFVLVDRGTVEMSVAGFQGAVHGLGDLLGRETIRAESAQSYGRHQGARVQLPLRYQRRVNRHDNGKTRSLGLV